MTLQVTVRRLAFTPGEVESYGRVLSRILWVYV